MAVFERGWLSANNVLFTGPEGAVLVDTGYCSHGDQTLALVRHALAGRPLDQVLNTHLHSDHCGGNALLQAHWPALSTAIPPGDAAAVAAWDEDALSYRPTGQRCPRFRFDRLLRPGDTERLGGTDWQVHAAPGHDPHSVVLFEPASRTLISADALWQHGFGVVFPELEGDAAFAEVAATLDVIARLAPATVVPGHGAVFTDVAGALAVARRRLDGFVAAPLRHAQYAAKVLLKFRLLECQRAPADALRAWATATPYFATLHARWSNGEAFDAWIAGLMEALVRSGAARWEAGVLVNA